MGRRFAVDIGGTFSDLVVLDDESGEVSIRKRPTTPEAPEKGVVALLSDVVTRHGDDDALFLHGTTIGLNAVLERAGATVGLITTRGFRDVLELRRGDREAMNDLLWRPAPPFVPRRLRRVVRERTLADGSVLVPLEDDDVRDVLTLFDNESVTSIAVVLINSYANPAHENAVEHALRRCGFNGEVSLSHRISGEYREYERTCTTVIDAYIRGVIRRYLAKLKDEVERLTAARECIVAGSNGGALLFEEAVERPVATIMSGPAAGAVAAGLLAADLGIEQAISADVGGTSFDTCFLRSGAPQLTFEGRVDGLPVQMPWVDVRSIGAGGGSIAYVDRGGSLRVGPQSAGAIPGPACYGKGGKSPTLTDAAAVLGMLPRDRLTGGIELDTTAAEESVGRLAAELELSCDAAAQAIVLIAAHNMAEAIREIAAERGGDPREASLVAFGGAGPLFACQMAGELEMGEIVVPPNAGNFSAAGLLRQDLLQSSARTWIGPLAPSSLKAIDHLVADLLSELEGRAVATAGISARTYEVALDLRYRGQEHSLTLACGVRDKHLEEGVEAIADRFHATYQSVYGHRLMQEIEVVAVRASLRRRFGAVPWQPEPERRSVPIEHEVEAYSFVADEWCNFTVLGNLPIGRDVLRGPAIILGDTTTVYVDAGFTCDREQSGTLRLRQTKKTGRK